MRQRINEHCRALDIKPQRVAEMTTMESIINMVAQGVGVIILPIGYLDYINTSFTEKTNIYARPAECLRSNCLWQ
ncbi:MULTISPECIES: LysR family transcriptional regulator substrate-binding protein [Paenibacillus]|uniref:LysR family transcriptional regulator substrate-binding protein n=1 Tax=Paenibacillus TaxID=44249 RepID=UPI003530B581